MLDFNASVEMALRTWYPKDHKLHLNPHHPLGKLLGEWGELLDDYMKSLYKPGYIFWPLDELGDVWYYERILCYQEKYTPQLFILSPSHIMQSPMHIDLLIATVIKKTATAFVNQREVATPISRNALDINYSVIYSLCDTFGITLERLTEANWEKLKPGSERGEQWMKARER